MRFIVFAIISATSSLPLLSQDGAVPATRPAPAVPSAGRAAALEVQAGLVDVANRVFPSVVTIRSYARGAPAARTGGPDEGSGWGESTLNDDYPGFHMHTACSGFVVGKDGDVLTCLHALQKSDGSLGDLIDVELQDRTRIIGEVIGTEPTVNLAIVRCMVFPTGRKAVPEPLRFGSSDALLPGQFVIGVGDPSGPEKFFSAGSFVARPTRDCYQELLSSFYLQASMVVPPQAYGGPLVNLDGEVVGILSPKNPKPGIEANDPRFGIEFVLPSKIVSGLYDSIRTARSFQSPWLGFSVMSRGEVGAARGVEAFNTMIKPRNGILIENVFTPSPAATAGIVPGDWLTTFNGSAVFEPVDFQKYMYLTGVGAKATLELFRNGEKLTKEITIERRPAAAMPK